MAKDALRRAIDQKLSVMYDATGKNLKQIQGVSGQALEQGYATQVLYVDASLEFAETLARKRLERTGRR